MFFGMCIYETLSDDGRLDTVIVSPSKDGVLLTDFRRDVGPSLGESVDLGPLRFYSEEHGLRVRTAKSILRPPLFSRAAGNITFRIDHLHWPLQPSHAGYYILLLPPGFSGMPHSQEGSCGTVYLTDTQQVLVHAFVYPDRPSLSIRGELRQGVRNPSDMETSTSAQTFNGDLPGVHYTPVSNLLRAMRHDLKDSKASAFLCHSSADKEAARRLAIELAMRDVRPWIDEAEIRTGDSLIQKIEDGIAGSTCLVPVLSKNSVASRWCKEELRMALATQIKSGVKGVLPALLEDCELPGFLLEKAYADLRRWDHYDRAVDTLAADIRHAANGG